MTSHRLAGVCAAVLLTGLAGCGKKDTKQSADSSPPQVSPVAPGGLGSKDKKDGMKPDFDVMLSELKVTAGKPKTDERPSGSTVLARFTSTFPPSHERRAEVYKALVEIATGPLPDKERESYIYWVARYAGKENVANLLSLARTYPAASSEVFKRLGELKEPSTFPAIAAMLNDKEGVLRLRSASTLKAIGAPAEKAVQPYARPTGPDGKPNDFVLRTVAVQILGEIGTAESLPLLQSLFNDMTSTIADLAKKASVAIQTRAK